MNCDDLVPKFNVMASLQTDERPAVPVSTRAVLEGTETIATKPTVAVHRFICLYVKSAHFVCNCTQYSFENLISYKYRYYRGKHRVWLRTRSLVTNYDASVMLETPGNLFVYLQGMKHQTELSWSQDAWNTGGARLVKVLDEQKRALGHSTLYIFDVTRMPHQIETQVSQ